MGQSQPLDLLGTRLESAGIPHGYASVVAHGVLDKLRRRCWQDMTDILGEACDLEAAAGWQGRKGALASALYECGLVGQDSGVFYLPSATTDAPEAVKRRWKRAARPSWDEAGRRAEGFEAKTPQAEPYLFEDAKPEPPPPLPSPVKKERKPRETKQPGHHELVTYWCERWEAKYGVAYPFQGADAKHVQRILAACGDLAAGREVVDCYLSSRNDWYAARGHKLSLLVGDLPKFIAARHAPLEREGEPPYAGADDPLRIPLEP